MNTYSTCTTCGDLMEVTEYDQRTHPACEYTPDALAALLHQYVAAATAGDDTVADQLEHAIRLYESAPPQFGAAALAYAAWGWPVFPLRDRGKIPLSKCRDCRDSKCDGPTNCGHDLCHGFKDATTNPDTIRRWWTEHPQANIGLATGHAFDVIDIDLHDPDRPDKPNGIWASLDLADDESHPDVHGTVTTPSGRHLYVTPTGGGNLAAVFPGVDYRGIGGYVVAPPSVRDNGARYQWAVRPSPRITDATKSAGERLKAA